MPPLPAGLHLPRPGQEPAVTGRILPPALLAVFLCGCARVPGPMPLPPQRPAEAQPQASHYLFFRDPAASQRILAGVSDEIIDDWRWVRRRAALRLSVDETQGIFFQAILTIPEEFVRAGGSRIDVRIDGRPLGSIPARQAGYVLWKRPVPEEWLQTGRDIEVELLADAEWRQGGTPRSYILSSAGFTL